MRSRRATARAGAGLGLLAALAVLSPGPARPGADRQAAYFALLDRDASGFVELDEYLAYLQQGFDALDRNGDGYLDDAELPAGARPSPTRQRRAHAEAVRASFRRQDLDRDGRLSPSELLGPPR